MVKEKPNSTRIYDKDGFRQRAACICVRSVEENEVSVWMQTVAPVRIRFGRGETDIFNHKKKTHTHVHIIVDELPAQWSREHCFCRNPFHLLLRQSIFVHLV